MDEVLDFFDYLLYAVDEYGSSVGSNVNQLIFNVLEIIVMKKILKVDVKYLSIVKK